MSLAIRAVRSTFFVAIGHYSTMLVSFSSTLVMSKLLDPADFGVFSLSLFFAGLFDVTGKLGLGFSLIHRKDINGVVLPTHFSIAMFSSIAGLCIALAASFLLPFFGYDQVISKVLVVLAAFSVVQNAGLTSQIVLEKELRFARTMTVMLTSLILSSLLGILMAYQGSGVWSLVAGNVTNSMLVTLGMCTVSSWRFWQGPFKIDLQVGKWFLGYGAVMVISSFATIGVLQLDNFLVGSLIGLTALGFYDRAYRIAQLPTALVTHVASKSSMSLYAKVQDDRVRLTRAFQVTMGLILNLSLPLALIVFIAAPEIVLLLLGDKWLQSVPLLRALLGFSILRPMQDDVGALLAAIGRPKSLSILLSVEAIIVLLAATPLTILMGAQGTALGVNLAFMVGMSVALWLARKSVDLNLLGIFRTPVLAAATGMVIWYAFLRNLGDTGLHPLFVFALKAAATTFVYALVFALLERNRMKEQFDYFRGLVRGAVG